MDSIIQNLIQSFDFALMLIINIITYGVIKFIDDCNGRRKPTIWQKRIVFLATAIILGTIYGVITDVPTNVIINSCIVAPIAWSWLYKPIANKFGIDYKKTKDDKR